MTKAPASLARRVMALVGLTIMACLAVLGWVVQNAIERHFAAMDASEMQAAAAAVRRSVETYGPDPARLDQTLSALRGVSFALYDGQQLLYRTPGPALEFLLAHQQPAIAAAGLRAFARQQHHYRGSALPLGQYRLALALNIDIHQHFLARFTYTLWGIMALAALITILAARLAVRWGHAPLRALSGHIRALSSDELSTPLDPAMVPTELRDLVAAFNDMLGRMADLFDRLSNFSADIAHELRTPLTNLVTQTQVALAQARPADEYREVLYSNLEEGERLARMVTDMLWLAQTDNGRIVPALTPLELRQELQSLCDYFELLADEKNISLTLTGDAVNVLADRHLLRRALSNLISNAIRYSAPGAAVRLQLASTATAAEIAICNPGDPIAAEHLPHLFDRFYRVDPARSREGVGLGLAITRSIARLHGGDVSVSSDSQQTCFCLTLPRRQQKTGA
ncbi:heavy metal sensor histidine kinase [Gallaecimonas sp. GXIMD1310]|uniref:heavy metal sensor histidine kinase n=1 Tax=Gallaecimonas sp. GXIMD1310 TaxID=3131926 RepID=UPI003253794E